MLEIADLLERFGVLHDFDVVRNYYKKNVFLCYFSFMSGPKIKAALILNKL